MNSARIIKITDDLADEALAAAKASERLRHFHILRQNTCETTALNALVPGTYVQPHKHDHPNQVEVFDLIKGRVAVVIFGSDGEIDPDNSVLLDKTNGAYGVCILPGTWHCLIALEPSVVFESKGHPKGGYSDKTAKTFASWAPGERTPEAKKYLKKLNEIIVNFIS